MVGTVWGVGDDCDGGEVYAGDFFEGLYDFFVKLEVAFVVDVIWEVVCILGFFIVGIFMKFRVALLKIEDLSTGLV